MKNTRAQLYKKCPIKPRDKFLRFWETGEIEDADIESTLKSCLVGRGFDPYNSGYRLSKIFQAILANSKAYKDRADQIVCERESPQYYIVRYRKLRLFAFDIKKKKGKWQRSYWGIGGSWEWNISSVEIDFPKSLLSEFERLDAQIDVNEKAKIERDKRLSALYKLIVEGTPVRSNYELLDLLKELVQRYWTFEGRYEEEKPC